MFSALSFVALILVGTSQAAPLTPGTPIRPINPILSNLPHSTTLSKNVTGIQSGQYLTNFVPSVDVNKTLTPEIIIFHPIPIKLQTCESAIDAKATQLAANLGTAASGYVTDSAWGTTHKDFEWGSVYCHDVTKGAHAVYGDIWLKWKATPNYGYPITDETGATDNIGTNIRYNQFSQNNAIYWTPQYGAHLIYGDIYATWVSIGGTKSTVGFPITDETGSGTHGGRFNDFSNGMIYWHAGNSYVHIGALPTTLAFTWNPIGLEDCNGWTTITFSSNGDARWQSYMHDQMPWPYDWSIAFVLMDADGTSVSLAQSGSVGPNLGFLGTNDANVDRTVNNAEISQNWRAWVAMTQWRAQADNSFAIGQMLTDLWNDFEKIYPYIAAAVALLS